MRLFILLIIFLCAFNANAEEKKIYLAGGCFWCLEEAYQDVDGVISAISGYSGGHTTNPTYEKISTGKTGHIEALEIIYDDEIINSDSILNIFFKNIDPFDENGQFCDKGYQYQSAIFLNSNIKQTLVNKYISIIENNYEKKVKTLVLEFDKFYEAEDYHQDFYIKNPIRYNYYKKGCGRVKRLKQLSIIFNE
jgi:peptide-methionine (S)-S-oxide reductase